MSFSVRFSRLYDLTVFKGHCVFDMCQLGWGEEGEAWRWRLFAWEEEMVGELMLLLHNVTLQVNKDDRWLWTFETSHAFSVRSVYNFLTVQPPIATSVVVSSLWHMDVLLKVVLFTWRLFWDRLPTKDNLFRRGVIDYNFMECVVGCGSVESSAHLLLHCNCFGSVWHFIYRWLCISAVVPLYVQDHFIQFSYSGGTAKVRQSILQAI